MLKYFKFKSFSVYTCTNIFVKVSDTFRHGFWKQILWYQLVFLSKRCIVNNIYITFNVTMLYCNCWASVWLFNCWCLTLCLQTSEEDVSQFDTKFTRQTPVDSPDDSVLSESANQVFVVSVLSIKFQSTSLALSLLSIYWFWWQMFVIPFTGIYICCPVSSRRAEQTMDIRERT